MYKTILLSFTLFIFYSHESQCQYIYLGANVTAQANSSVAEPNSASIYTNPAGMAAFEKSSINVSYQQIFPIEGLSISGFYGTYYHPKLSIGISADQFGDQFYHESRIGLAIAKKQDRVSMGIKASFMNNGIKDYPNRNGFLTEFGILVKLNPKLNAGMHVVNITSAHIYESAAMPTVVNLGLSYEVSKQVKFNSQAEYPVGNKPKLRIGFSYLPTELIVIRCGLNPANKAIHFGLGINYKKYNFNYAAVTNTAFGLTSSFSISLFFKN